jgi:hypothetical protein
MAQNPYCFDAITPSAAWEVEFTEEFEEWWHRLSESEQGKVDARVGLLMERGPNLGFPFSTQVKTSRSPEMRELRGRRRAILLVAGDKTGDDSKVRDERAFGRPAVSTPP